MSRELFVGNLSYSTSEENLQELFSQYGTTESVKVIFDKETGRSRGFCFITMSTDEEAQRAIEGLNGQHCDGRDLKVNLSEPREKRAPGSGSGYGGGGGGRSGGGYGGGGSGGRSGGGGGYGGNGGGRGGNDRGGGSSPRNW